MSHSGGRTPDVWVPVGPLTDWATCAPKKKFFFVEKLPFELKFDDKFENFVNFCIWEHSENPIFDIKPQKKIDFYRTENPQKPTKGRARRAHHWAMIRLFQHHKDLRTDTRAAAMTMIIVNTAHAVGLKLRLFHRRMSL